MPTRGGGAEPKGVLDAVTSDSRYQRNIEWGLPRPGHPEGSIRAHIFDLEQNLERFRDRLSENDYWRLKVLIHVHDTFKPDAAASSTGHGQLARAFLAEFSDDAELLAAVELHDEPYVLHRQLKSSGSVDEERFETLLRRITDWDLFLIFNIIDGSTEGKGPESLRWLINSVDSRVRTSVTVADIPQRDGGLIARPRVVAPALAVGAAPRSPVDVATLKSLGITHWAHHGRRPLTAEVVEAAPPIETLVNPTQDDANPKPVEWFARTLAFAQQVAAQSGYLFVSCSRGEHRGPVMAYAILRVNRQMSKRDAEACMRNASFEIPLRYSDDVEANFQVLRRSVGIESAL
jgi:hypothetical protein